MNIMLNIFVLVMVALLSQATSHPAWAEGPPAQQAAPRDLHGIQDQPIAAFQKELLDLAFEAATAIPVHPHIKDRSRTQEAVVVATLTLAQPQRAKRYIEQIANWRRGVGYADLASYLARHDQVLPAQHYLSLATAVAQDSSVEAWRRDRIRVSIAKVHLGLGQVQQADHIAAHVENSEVGKVAQAKATLSSQDSFQQQTAHLDTLIQSGNFDLIKNALGAYARLFDHFYTDPIRRPQIEQKIKMSLGKLPPLFQIDLLMDLTKSALKHADLPKALDAVNTVQTTLDGHQWPPQYGIPLRARLAALRFQAGDKHAARTYAEAALATFNTTRARMVDIYRAETLRPLAEAYQSMGDTATALAIYKRAVEEGVQNPNSRPHAEDLSATCRSMAVYAVAPDATLWARLREIRDGLGRPW